LIVFSRLTASPLFEYSSRYTTFPEAEPGTVEVKGRQTTKAKTAFTDLAESRRLGQDLDKNPESIERSLRREQEKRGGTLSPLTQKYWDRCPKNRIPKTNHRITR
jgi:hypothetical protein